MKITVRYLGGSRVQAGCDSEVFDVGPAATVASVVALVRARHPGLAPWLGSVRWARNYQFTTDSAPLSEGDELALIPPVSGGAPSAILTREPLSPSEVQSWVAAPGVGATVLFVGTVRDHARGKQVTRLEYEAYEPMATRELERIAAACASGRPGCAVAIAHRFGALAVGEISVVIAAASPHRDAAFEACREALERIKVDVPIWKMEITTDGESWVGWGGG